MLTMLAEMTVEERQDFFLKAGCQYCTLCGETFEFGEELDHMFECPEEPTLHLEPSSPSLGSSTPASTEAEKKEDRGEK